MSHLVHRALLRLLSLRPVRRLVSDAFHLSWYGAPGLRQYWKEVSWLGRPVLKNPLDLWLYQQIVYAQAPDVIVETGTYRGGSTYYLACLCDMTGKGRVVTVDLYPQPDRPAHPRITYLTGSSTDPAVFQQVQEFTRGAERVMVILDSDHRRDHVLAELRLYHALVTPGAYLIVEDTNVNGHPVFPGHGPGPAEAVRQFLRENPAFSLAPANDQMLVTFNPGGFLVRSPGS